MVADKKKWLAKIQQYVNQKKQKLAYSEWYFCGNFKHNDRIASTTTILNSSAISDIKLVICFIKRSTLASLPVFNSVVIASVAMLLFWSEIKLSMSMLQFVTAKGYVIATCKGCPNKKNSVIRMNDPWRETGIPQKILTRMTNYIQENLYEINVTLR